MRITILSWNKNEEVDIFAYLKTKMTANMLQSLNEQGKKDILLL